MAKSPAPRPRKSPTFNRPVKDLEPPSLNVREPDPNFELLSESDKEEILKRARVKVEAAERDRAWQAYLEAEIERLEKEAHPEAYEEEKDITIDLPIYADRLIINGRQYMHGRTYKVKKGLYDSMRDMMAWGHRHYHSTHIDPSTVMLQRQQDLAKDGPSMATISASGSMGPAASAMLSRRGQF